MPHIRRGSMTNNAEAPRRQSTRPRKHVSYSELTDESAEEEFVRKVTRRGGSERDESYESEYEYKHKNCSDDGDVEEMGKDEEFVEEEEGGIDYEPPRKATRRLVRVLKKGEEKGSAGRDTGEIRADLPCVQRLLVPGGAYFVQGKKYVRELEGEKKVMWPGSGSVCGEGAQSGFARVGPQHTCGAMETSNLYDGMNLTQAVCEVPTIPMEDGRSSYGTNNSTYGSQQPNMSSLGFVQAAGNDYSSNDGTNGFCGQDLSGLGFVGSRYRPNNVTSSIRGQNSSGLGVGFVGGSSINSIPHNSTPSFVGQASIRSDFFEGAETGYHMAKNSTAGYDSEDVSGLGAAQEDSINRRTFTALFKPSSTFNSDLKNGGNMNRGVYGSSFSRGPGLGYPNGNSRSDSGYIVKDEYTRSGMDPFALPPTHCAPSMAPIPALALDYLPRSSQLNIGHTFRSPEEKRYDEGKVEEWNRKILLAAGGLTNRRVPKRLEPPVLDPNREEISAHNVDFYAAEGAKDIWRSAFSSTRFRGPRRHPPFRELHRLTDPPLADTSDWAENIRWAKEQFREFRTVWIEWDDHLHKITKHRREILWVSREAIEFGRWPRELLVFEEGYAGDDVQIHPNGWVEEIRRPGQKRMKGLVIDKDLADRIHGAR